MQRPSDIDTVVDAGPFAADWESLKGFRVPQWYQDGKFGIFMHWGLYSVPAFSSEWYPRNMYKPGTDEFNHHVATYGPHDKFGYKDFIPQLTFDGYDPDAYAKLFKEAGARFVVPVAEHHDGFAMYDSKLSRWTAAKMGPKRDVVGQLADAVRREGLVFGLSSHRIEHYWFFDEGMKYPSDVQDPEFADLYGPARPAPSDLGSADAADGPDEAFMDDWLARTCELVDLYRPELVWFDWWIQQPPMQPYLQKFAAYYYNRGAEWGREVAINYKHKAFADGTAVLDLEKGQLAQIRPQLWQNDTTVSRGSWGWVTSHEYRKVGDIIADLADIVSKNGALLLNIGPMPDGTIPEPEQQILRDIGAWLSVNGEAIYGTSYWKLFGEGPTEIAEGQFTDLKRSAFTSEDIRFTVKGDALYAILLSPPAGDILIRSLASDGGYFDRPISRVSLLGSDEVLQWYLTDKGLRVTRPKSKPCEHAIVLKIV